MSMATEGERRRSAFPMKGYALAIALHHDVYRTGYIVFGIVETTAKAIGASLMYCCRLNGLAGGGRARGAEFITAASSACIVSMDSVRSKRPRMPTMTFVGSAVPIRSAKSDSFNTNFTISAKSPRIKPKALPTRHSAGETLATTPLMASMTSAGQASAPLLKVRDTHNARFAAAVQPVRTNGSARRSEPTRAT
jgi:hypothetical protein